LERLASISELKRINLEEDRINIDSKSIYEKLECERNHGNKEACEAEMVKGKRKCFYNNKNNKCYYAKWNEDNNQQRITDIDREIESINQRLR
jgi:hypothetical protein